MLSGIDVAPAYRHYHENRYLHTKKASFFLYTHRKDDAFLA